MRFFLLAIPLWAGAVWPVAAMSRVDGLVNALTVMCMVEPLNFDRLDQKATAMRMRVLTDFAPPEHNGIRIRSKTWLMGMTDGPLAFSVSDAKTGARRLSTCAISAPDATPEEIRTALVETFHLGEPRMLAGPGGRPDIAIWDKAAGAGTRFMLTTGIYKPRPGFNLVYEVEQASGAEPNVQ